MASGSCGLCGVQAILIDSHLLASAFYKILGTGSNPVLFDTARQKAVQVTRHTTKHFLCRTCEDLFKVAEDVVSANCWRDEGKFRLLGSLSSCPKIDDFWSALPISVKAKEYMYFAASVFWRASATHWNDSSVDHYFGALNIEYEVLFRNFLLGKSPLPTEVKFVVEVANDVFPNYMLFPYRSRLSAEHRKGPPAWLHYFFVPGLTFKMILPRRSSVDLGQTQIAFKEITFGGSEAHRIIDLTAANLTLAGKLRNSELAKIWPTLAKG
jgi:hypothetical protein